MHPFCRICAGCNSEIHGRFLSCMGAVWHPECFCCNACKLPITDYEVFLLSSWTRSHPSSFQFLSSSFFVFVFIHEVAVSFGRCFKLVSFAQFSMQGNQPYHKSCYKELYHPRCDVCNQFVSICSFYKFHFLKFRSVLEL